MADADLDLHLDDRREILEPDIALFIRSAKKSWDVILTNPPDAVEFTDRFEAFMAN